MLQGSRCLLKSVGLLKAGSSGCSRRAAKATIQVRCTWRFAQDGFMMAV
ncbi:hypothetical protein ACP70R_005363 [Stipagrostis hirtigluma subsp. patula]